MNLRIAARDVLLRNRRTTNGYQYTVPSTDHYPYQWLWDSCFHAIILARLEPEAAKRELESLLSRQFEDGLVPHLIYWKPGILHLFDWGVEGTSNLTQPPLIAYAAWVVYEHTGDSDFLERVYPKILAFYKYLIGKRDPRDNHLIGIINPDESGEDNSPRFDEPLGASIKIAENDHLNLRKGLVEKNRVCNFDIETCMRDFFWVKDVPFNAILVENLRAVARIASIVKHPDGEQFGNLHADLVAQAMREHMFEDGVYWSTSGVEYKKLKVATWAHMAPLFAGLYTEEEATHVVKKHLLNPDTFWGRYGVRTVSKQESAYDPDGYTNSFSWRGPVWFAPHWFIYRGLVRYGFMHEARMIREKSAALIERHGFRECFNAETGEPQGARDFTWGTLVLDMIEV